MIARGRAAALTALLALAGAAGCAHGSSGTAPGAAAPRTTLPPGVRLTAPGTVTGPAGAFAHIARDRATGRWYLPSGTRLAPSSQRIDLSAVGSAATFEAAFRTGAGPESLHGYGLTVLDAATSDSVARRRGYSIFFEEPNRLDIYREDGGRYTDINDTRPPVAVAVSGEHALRVVVTRSAPARIDIATFVDGSPASSAHDERDVPPALTWGLTNLSNVTFAIVQARPVTVSHGALK